MFAFSVDNYHGFSEIVPSKNEKSEKEKELTNERPEIIIPKRTGKHVYFNSGDIDVQAVLNFTRSFPNEIYSTPVPASF